ncbi:MAG UNVERIFIED_CONTAM: carboxymuconolactone decarboxylase family protein [Planctomycetaceae bacterium]|jgi:alkyl hydroperoxide reductase subunit D
MAVVEPVLDAGADEKVAQVYGRIREVLQVEEIPEVFRYFANVPAFLQDFFMNFRKFVLGPGKLDEKRKLLIAVAVAGQAGSGRWQEYLETFAVSRGITPQELIDVLAVGATNSMYNVLFKFRDISGSDVFGGMSIGLRAQRVSGHQSGRDHGRAGEFDAERFKCVQALHGSTRDESASAGCCGRGDLRGDSVWGDDDCGNSVPAISGALNCWETGWI